jgi:glutaredoxin
MIQVKIYSTDWCGFCKAEKRFLTDHHIAYDDVNIEAEPHEADAMMKLSGQTGVPFTVITKDDGATVGVLGFDRPRLARELGLT